MALDLHEFTGRSLFAPAKSVLQCRLFNVIFYDFLTTANKRFIHIGGVLVRKDDHGLRKTLHCCRMPALRMRQVNSLVHLCFGQVT